MGLDMYIGKRNAEVGPFGKKLREAIEKKVVLEKELDDLWDQAIEKAFRDKGYNGIKDESLDMTTRQEIYGECGKVFNDANETLLHSHAEARDYVDSHYAYRDLGYWRKHADLNGYFTKLYQERDGSKEFNCQNLILSKEDCEDVLELAKGIIDGTKQLDKSSGFFWGESDEDDWINTVAIIEKVLVETDFATEEVVYHCWY